MVVFVDSFAVPLFLVGNDLFRLGIETHDSDIEVVFIIHNPDFCGFRGRCAFGGLFLNEA